MADLMTFPNTFDEFAEKYKIVDKHEVYTNGTELIPIFRVKQWLDHCSEERAATVREFAEKLKRYYNALDGRTPAVLVAYHIDQIKEEMLKTDKKCD